MNGEGGADSCPVRGLDSVGLFFGKFVCLCFLFEKGLLRRVLPDRTQEHSELQF